MTRLVTPHGVLVYDGPPVTPEWFEARRSGITGTDLPKILGITKYGNALSVWRDKRGELEDDGAMEAAHWGNILENPVAEEWARRNNTYVESVGVIAHASESWMRASLDRTVRYCPDDATEEVHCGLEIKTRSAYKSRDYDDDIPDDVLAQVAWGLAVTGYEHMHVAVLIGGQRLRSFTVPRDGVLEGYLIEAADRVWRAVLDGVPPEVHPDSEGVLLDQLNDMWRDRAGDVDLPSDLTNDLIASYREGTALENQGKRIKTESKTALVQMLGSGSVGVVGETPVFTYRPPEPKDEVTADALKAYAVANPEMYEALREDGLITRSQPGPRFNLKSRGTRNLRSTEGAM